MRYVRAMLLAAAFMTGAALPATATPLFFDCHGTVTSLDITEPKTTQIIIDPDKTSASPGRKNH